MYHPVALEEMGTLTSIDGGGISSTSTLSNSIDDRRSELLALLALGRVYTPPYSRPQVLAGYQ